jgi:uncharacterized protein (DUF58 family)
VIEALRGLTTRGRSFLAAAGAAFLSAFILGETDLLRVAALLAVLPLLAAWHVGRGRHRLACARTCEPARVPVGTDTRVRLKLQNLSRLVTGTLLLEDRLPYALGNRPRLILERLSARQASSVAYTVRAEARGRYLVGPLSVRLTDPFGLCELTRTFPTVDRLTVTPEVTALPAVRMLGEFAGSGESRSRSVAVHGEDDQAIREYRHGDDLRRVHWRSTARSGELMVRREEQPWESRATVVLDTRPQAHHGEGPAASFEWAVSAAASIAVHLRRVGFRVRLVSGTIDVDTHDAAGDGLLLDSLAEVRTRSEDDLATLADRVRQRYEGGLVVGIFGQLTVAETEVLGRLRSASASGVAFLMETAGWLRLGAEARERADDGHQAATLSLIDGGWRVVDVRHGSRLDTLWPQVGRRGSPGFAWRAALAETVAGGWR